MLRDACEFGLDKTLKERKAGADMRMDATGIADVTGHDLLAKGKPTAAAADQRQRYNR